MSQPPLSQPGDQRDVFVCHASEDKAGFVEPLVAALKALGVTVWYDRFEIRLGDDFRRKMDEGLRCSRFGLVVVSPRSDKYWTNAELSALLTRESLAGAKAPSRILPVRVELTAAELASRSLLLGSRRSVGWEDGVDAIARQIAAIVRDERIEVPLSRSPTHNLPLRRAPTFVGRDADLARLLELLTPGRRVRLTASIEGLAGVGKTELALQSIDHLAHTARFPAGIFWLEAENPDLTVTWGGTIADELAVPPGPPTERTASVMRIITSGGPALVVLDNVTGWSEQTAPRPLPTAPHVAILATTRARDLAGFEAVPLECLDDDAARALILALAKRDLPRESGLEALLAYLAGHTLAVELAGAFLREVPSVSPAEYLSRLQAGRSVEDKVVARTRYERTVRQALDATSERLDAPARTALRIAANFAPDEGTVELLSLCGVDEDALAALRRYHLVSGTGERWTMHRLVREYGRRQGTDDEKASAQRAFVDGCAARADAIDLQTGFRIYRADRPHFDRALKLANAALADAPVRLGRFLDRVGNGAHSSGDLPRARDLLAQALAFALGHLSEDHLDVATSRSHLALVLWGLGDLAGARDLHERALGCTIRHLGEDHPNVATIRSNLALVLQGLGDLEGARDLLEQSLASGVRHLGDDHPSVALRRSNLATVLRDLGDLAGARHLVEEALASDLRHLGEDHPEVAIRRNVLALVLIDLGDLPPARDLLEQALAFGLRHLGEDHPDVTIWRANLAAVLKRLGDLAGARGLLERVLASALRHLGEDHPNVAIWRSNLATLCIEEGDIVAARDLFAMALAGDERTLGPDHPVTAVMRARLAAAKHRLGDRVGALADMRRALDAVRGQPEGSIHRTHVERIAAALGVV